MDEIVLTKTREWMFFAKSDFKTSALALMEGIFHISTFHSQQSVEKCIKAYFVYKGVGVPKIHNLLGLLDYFEPLKQLLADHAEGIRFLDQFYVISRYPDIVPGASPDGLPTQSDAQRAVEYAQQIMLKIEMQIE